ncbi:hypothetical protein [Microbulbifer sp. ALW1]|uniref:hypothetical protein n=1 Tax=Microbulbifer sp. (strain ALW1) TaxID=1516059 RepID=UPI001357431A|nr:hypothetical protein [Microbulbifer sp. ALW1]
MKKVLLSVVSIFVPMLSQGYECFATNNSSDVPINYEAAKHVVMGYVESGEYRASSEVNGKYSPSQSKIHFRVTHSFKGNLSGVVSLSAPVFPSIGTGWSLGSSYILFLHDESEIGICSKVIELFLEFEPGIDPLTELEGMLESGRSVIPYYTRKEVGELLSEYSEKH